MRHLVNFRLGHKNCLRFMASHQFRIAPARLGPSDDSMSWKKLCLEEPLCTEREFSLTAPGQAQKKSMLIARPIWCGAEQQTVEDISSFWFRCMSDNFAKKLAKHNVQLAIFRILSFSFSRQTELFQAVDIILWLCSIEAPLRTCGLIMFEMS